MYGAMGIDRSGGQVDMRDYAMQNPMQQIMQMYLDNMYRQQQYQMFNNSLPANLRITPQTGQAQADRARSEYMTKTLNPMVAEARTSDLNSGQDSTFAGGRIAALQTAGAAEASRLAENARDSYIDNVDQARQSYFGAPVGGMRSSGTPAEQAPGSSWLDRLPAYAQLAYGGANALRYASPYVSQGIGGMGNMLGGAASSVGRGLSSIFRFGQRPNPIAPAGNGYRGPMMGDGSGDTYGYQPNGGFGAGF